jgi:hypothetical protein
MDTLHHQLAEALLDCRKPLRNSRRRCLLSDVETRQLSLAIQSALEKLDAALAAYDAAKAEQETNGGWLPIESAPRDGRIVRLWDKCSFDGAFAEGEFRPTMVMRPVDGSYAVIANARTISPTLWHPLPPPPEQT